MDAYLKEKLLDGFIEETAKNKYLLSVRKKKADLFFEPKLTTEEWTESIHYAMGKTVSPQRVTDTKDKIIQIAKKIKPFLSIEEQEPDKKLSLAFLIEFPTIHIKKEHRGVFDILHQAIEQELIYDKPNHTLLFNKVYYTENSEIQSYKDVKDILKLTSDEGGRVHFKKEFIDEGFQKRFVFLRENPIIRESIESDYLEFAKEHYADSNSLCKYLNEKESTSYSTVFIQRIFNMVFNHSFRLWFNQDRFLNDLKRKLYLLPPHININLLDSSFLELKKEITAKLYDKKELKLDNYFQSLPLNVIKEILHTEFPDLENHTFDDGNRKLIIEPDDDRYRLIKLLREDDNIQSIGDITDKFKATYGKGDRGKINSLLLRNEEFYCFGKTGYWVLLEKYPDYRTIYQNGTVPNMVRHYLSTCDQPQHLWAVSKYISSVTKREPSSLRSIDTNIYLSSDKELFRKYSNVYIGLAEKEYGDFKAPTLRLSDIKEEFFKNSLLSREELLALIKESNKDINDDIQADWLIEYALNIERIIEKDNLLAYNPDYNAVTNDTPGLNDLYPNGSNSAEEGDKKIEKHTRIERNSEIVKQFKEKFTQYICDICEEDLEEKYNEKCIEVHHKIPLCKSGKTVTSDHDLVLLCPNCHSILHIKMRKDEDLRYDDIRLMISEALSPDGLR